MSGEVVMIKRKTLAEKMTCPLCNKLITKATSIMECLHTFCRKCIYDKLKDEELDHCPVCKIDLGASPTDKLRHDHLKDNLRLKIFGSEMNNAQPIAEQVVPSVTLPEPTQEIPTCSVIPNSSESVPANNVDNSRESAEAERQDSNTDPELVQPSTGLVQIANQPTAKESNALCSSGDSGKNRAQEHVGSSSANNARTNPIWFNLTASQVGESPLPQIPKSYIKIKDGRLQVSTLKKYVVQKLGLPNEAEVEISLGGYLINSTVQLKDLLQWWLNNSPLHSQKIQTRVGSSGKDFVMPLTYGRKSD